MTESAIGLILRTRPLTETSLIVNWLTPNLGRISTVAKGARRPKSNLRGKLDLFYLADFSFQRSRRSELHILREVSLRETHSQLRNDISALQQAAYAVTLVEQSTETETPLAEVYQLLVRFLNHLTHQPAQPRNIFALELKLLEELGLNPDLGKSQLAAATKNLVNELLAADWPEIAELKASTVQARELRQFLHGFLIFHLGKIPKGRAECLGTSPKPAQLLTPNN
jgi:DNA repair protein RecO (recombination protein O)